MNKILLLFAILFSTLTFAQVPQGISYQAIALNGSGNPVSNSNVGIRLSILNNSASGTILYTETHTKMTNAQGLFNLVIGQGTAVSGTFTGINWSVNSKFIKIEMDVAGGANYALIGTTQLLSVPYALASDSLITSAGEGITLVSPNGTPYTISVNDAGQLSLPTSGASTDIPTNLYLYGSFNGYDAATALLTSTNNQGGALVKLGYKYLTSGTTIKYVTQNNSSAPVYGFNAPLQLVLNGDAYTIPSTGFYYLSAVSYNVGVGNSPYNFVSTVITPQLEKQNSGNLIFPTYNAGTNTFTFIANGITNTSGGFRFKIENPETSNGFGDSLADGTIDLTGPDINFPNTTATPKNFRVDLVINFNGSGTYTITQI